MNGNRGKGGKGGKGKIFKSGRQNDKIYFKVIHSDCQYFISKQTSIEDIIHKKSWDVYRFNEAALQGRRKIIIINYFSFSKNTEKHMGGIPALVWNHLRSTIFKLAEGREADKYTCTRYDYLWPPLNIVNKWWLGKANLGKGQKWKYVSKLEQTT